MGMQYSDSNGNTMTEYFKSLDDLKKRKEVIEREGGKVHRIVEVHTNPRYPIPHQGSKEVERRRKALERAQAKSA